MRITIPDELAEAVGSQMPLPAFEEEVARRVRATAHIPAGARFLALPIAELDRIGMALGRTLPPLTVDQLCAMAERNASIKLGEVRLDFSAGQLEEIQRLADREGREVGNYIARIAQAILAGFFRTPPFQEEGLLVTRTIVEAETAPVPAAPTA